LAKGANVCGAENHEAFFNSIGQKQTFALQKAMSALPPIATAKADTRPVS
jgi:hypothetical protein